MSPVVGVVLLAGITLLLFATVAVFFGAPQTQTQTQDTDSGPPTVEIDHAFDSRNGGHALTLSVTGGDTVPKSNLRLVVEEAACSESSVQTNGRFVPAGRFGSGDSGMISQGTEFELTARTLCGSSSETLLLSGSRVSLVWVSPDGSRSDVLFRWQGPTS